MISAISLWFASGRPTAARRALSWLIIGGTMPIIVVPRPSAWAACMAYVHAM